MSYMRESERGTITVTAPTLADLVTRAAEAVDGVRVRRGRRRLDVRIDGDRGYVALELTARYGLILPEIAREVQERVRDVLGTMCGVSTESIDVTVEEVE
jgi:uncharacterized alkaline shock family protein YloU